MTTGKTRATYFKSSKICLVVALLLAACAKQGPGDASQDASEPFASLAELELALEAIRLGGETETSWQRVLASGPMPLVFGRTAVFLYRGEANLVEWRGDLSSWSPSWNAQGERLGSSDIWRKSLQLLPASRLDYKIVIDGETWLLDPLNPYSQAGGSGANSEARMPGWQPSRFASSDDNVPRGKLSAEQVVVSKHLGYAVKFRVYTPPGIDPKATALQSIYVTDGPDYYRDDWGGMQIVLDNLFAEGKIEPVIAVFISQWNLDNTENRRITELVAAGPGECGFCEFIIEELIPIIDTSYPVSARGRHRAILGTSLGGLFATYMMLWHGDQFGKIAIQSPAYQYPAGQFIHAALMDARDIPQQVFLNVGLYEMAFMSPTVQAARHLQEAGVDLLYLEVPDGHSWGHWRTTIDDALLFFYGNAETESD